MLALLKMAFSGKEEEYGEQLTMNDLKSGAKGDKVTNEDDEREEFFKQLDKYGPYEREMTGALTLDALRRLRDCINFHAYRKFQPRKEALMFSRIEDFKKADWKAYNEKIQQAAKEYMKVMEDETLAALEFLDVSKENYGMSMQQAMTNP